MDDARLGRLRNNICTDTTDPFERCEVFKEAPKGKAFEQHFDSVISSPEAVSFIAYHYRLERMLSFLADGLSLTAADIAQSRNDAQICSTIESEIHAMAIKEELNSRIDHVKMKAKVSLVHNLINSQT